MWAFDLPRAVNPAVSPSGDKIAFYLIADDRFSVALAERDRGRWQVSDLGWSQGAPEPYACPVWSPDGSGFLLASSAEGTLIRYQGRSGGKPERLTVGSDGSFHVLQFFNDGAAVLALGAVEGSVNLWKLDLRDPRPGRLTDHLSPVVSAALHPSGAYVAYSANDTPQLANLDVHCHVPGIRTPYGPT